MKYVLGILAAFCLLMTSCKVGNMASSQGMNDQAFLYFTSTQKYSEPVNVTLDNKVHFDAKVVKEGPHTVKGDTYAVGTGKRHIVVSYKNKIIFEKEIFLSTQDTKKITLP